MMDTLAELRRVLAMLEGPLRFAQKSEHALQSLRGFDQLVARAAAEARRLALAENEQRAVDRLVQAAHGFDHQGLEQRRRSLQAISAELARLTGQGSQPPAPTTAPPTVVKAVSQPPPPRAITQPPPVKPPPAPEPDAASRLRVRSLTAEGSLAPVAVEGEQLTRPLSTLKGIGPAVTQRLAARGLHTFADVLLYLPRRYEDRRSVTPIALAREAQHVLVAGRIVSFQEKFARKRVYELEVEDDSGQLVARWFGFKPGQFRGFIPGAPVVLSGEVRIGFRERREMIHPDLELGEAIDDQASFGRIIPVYTDIEGISQRAYRRIAQRVVEACAHEIQDFLPERFRAAHDLVALPEALARVHFPPDDVDPKKLERFSSPPQRRLVFDELFFVQMGLALKKRGVQVERGVPFHTGDEVIGKALERLPFQLTNAQRRALDEIARDLAKATPMNRLLQGDVGSGKTAVALASALVAVENGFQAAIMAPTELLAEQHQRTFEKLLGSGLFAPKNGLPPIHTTLLSGSRKPKEMMRAKNEVASGTARIVVGTHALIQEGVEFQKLGLIVIDEQHRFGVLQRARLMEKGIRPHVLVMTATPIPRTLALTLYGDLDVSIIDELPPGRTPIVTKAFSGRTRSKAYDFIRKQVALGHQAYVVLPLVEESEKLELRAATEEHERLQKEEFVNLKVGLAHGRMSPEERSAAMEAFRRGDTQVLVATTVIEVGVDVPNASVMLIEHAERFGLSQLHQLRGRVGRGAAKSFCLLVHGDEQSNVARERLAVMVRTNNGFELAEADLEIRGPGEFLGTRQSGMPDLVVADLLRDQLILKEAREAAFELIAKDPDLKAPEHRSIAGELKRRWSGKISLARIG